MSVLYEILVATVFSLLLSPDDQTKNSENSSEVYLEGKSGMWYNLKERGNGKPCCYSNLITLQDA